MHFSQFFGTLIPSIIILATGLLPAFVVLFLYKRQTREKRSPLTMELLRSPGESLREQIDDVSDKILEKAIYLLFIPAALFSVLFGQQFFSGSRPGWTVLFIFAIGIVFACIWLGKQIYSLMVERNQLRLGYECELATGQALAPLAREGYHIFHDFPADKFNIDHITVGPHGVFAVETKGRSKAAKAENDNWKLRFDGRKLYFSGNEFGETGPVDQARRQAKWLAQWIEKAVAETVEVIPVLVFPGWFIEFPRNRPDVILCNGKHFSFLTKKNAALSAQQIQRIAYQIEGQCRTVQGKAYQN